MSKLTRSMIFLRAFMAVLVAGLLAGRAPAQSDDEGDWARAQAVSTPDAYFTYLLRNPRGAYVEDALEELRARGALNSGGPADLSVIRLY
ncbi:MAG: hypothetical protein AAGB18_00095 [Pseudomonadota bacterium]